MRFPGLRSDLFPSGEGPDDIPSVKSDRAPATDILSIVTGASQSLLRAKSDADVLRVLLSAAADLGAPKPRAGLWRADDMAYAMSFIDTSGEAVPCGSAPAGLYAGAAPMEDPATQPAPVMLLSSRGRRWGVLDVSGQVSDVSVLSALALLVRNALLRLDAAAKDDGGAEGDTVLEALERWWSTPDTDSLLQAALADVPRLCRADSCALTLLDPAHGTLRMLFSEDLGATVEGATVRWTERTEAPDDSEPQSQPAGGLPWKGTNDTRRNGEAVRRAFNSKEPVAFRWNPMTEALKEGLLPSGPSEGSYVALPLIESGQAIGVLDVYSSEPRRFGPSQDAALAHAARTLARILGYRERALCQVETGRRQDILMGVAGGLAQHADLKPMAALLARTARQMWHDADITYAMLPQVEGGLWSIAAQETSYPDDQRQGWARAGEGFAGWVIQTRQPLIISSATDDPRRGSLDRGQNVASGMWVPMRRGDTLFGLLAVASRENKRTYGPDDLESLERLAEQGAVALERARERHSTNASFWDAIEAIAGAIDARDGYTHGHSRNVTEYAVAIAQRMNMPMNEIQTLRASALLHDIGKIGIPDHILNKPGGLTPDERTIMESHPEIGYEILLRATSLQALLPGVRYHHERPDGLGYPVGLSGEVLPMQARIIAVADAFDAMTSDRVYRKRMTVERAMGILIEGRGTQWDAGCVDTFEQLVRELSTPRLQMLTAEDSGRQYLPSLGTDVFGTT